MPSIHAIQKHQGSRGLQHIIWFAGSIFVIVFLIIVGWLCYVIYQFAIDPKYFNDLLWLDGIHDASPEALIEEYTGDKGAAGEFWGAVFGGILAGGLTLLAAIVALSGALIQMRREANKDFLEWVVEFSHTFHADKDYCEVRQSLAEHRNLFFKWMYDELMGNALGTVHPASERCVLFAQSVNTDGIEVPEETEESKHLCPMIRKKDGKEKINWMFVRKATDFFRFYEMVLLVAQRLPDVGSQRETFIGSFAWHIKWILCSWGGECMTDQVNNRLIIIYYLAFNHFESLCSVALCFILQYRNVLQDDLNSGQKNIHGATSEEVEKCVKLISTHVESIYEIFNLQNAIKLANQKQLTDYWIKILGHRGAIR